MSLPEEGRLQFTLPQEWLQIELGADPKCHRVSPQTVREWPEQQHSGKSTGLACSHPIGSPKPH